MVIVDENGEPRNGYISDQDRVKKYLDPTKIYTIEKIVIHNWSTDVYLKEVTDTFATGRRVYFNSVCLKEV